MPLFSSNQPSIRARLLPRFPARVLAGTGITITKDGGAYIFAVSAEAGTIPLSRLEPISEGTLVGRGSGAGAGVPVEVAVAGGLNFNGNVLQLAPNVRTRSLNAQFDFVPPGTFDVFQDFYVASTATLKAILLFTDVPAGNVIVDIWKTSFAGFPPTGANSICGTARPTLTTGMQKLLFTSAQMAAAGWTTTVNAGDVIRLVAGSVSGINQLVVAAEVEIT